MQHAPTLAGLAPYGAAPPPVPGVGSVTVPRIFGKDKVKKGDREETSDTQKEIGERGKGRSSSNDEAGGQFDGPPPRRRAQSPT